MGPGLQDPGTKQHQQKCDDRQEQPGHSSHLGPDLLDLNGAALGIKPRHLGPDSLVDEADQLDGRAGEGPVGIEEHQELRPEDLPHQQGDPAKVHGAAQGEDQGGAGGQEHGLQFQPPGLPEPPVQLRMALVGQQPQEEDDPQAPSEHAYRHTQQAAPEDQARHAAQPFRQAPQVDQESDQGIFMACPEHGIEEAHEQVAEGDHHQQ